MLISSWAYLPVSSNVIRMFNREVHPPPTASIIQHTPVGAGECYITGCGGEGNPRVGKSLQYRFLLTHFEPALDFCLSCAFRHNRSSNSDTFGAIVQMLELISAFARRNSKRSVECIDRYWSAAGDWLENRIPQRTNNTQPVDSRYMVGNLRSHPVWQKQAYWVSLIPRWPSLVPRLFSENTI